MVVALNDSMNKNIELNTLKTQAEKKQLIAQFNPHFLFNTLETIRYLILIKPSEASELILKTIRDNGYGINEDKLIEIHKMIKEKDNNSTHQGIYNVFKRLYLVYENDLIFEIESNNKGTMIFVSFPRGV